MVAPVPRESPLAHPRLNCQTQSFGQLSLVGYLAHEYVGLGGCGLGEPDEVSYVYAAGSMSYIMIFIGTFLDFCGCQFTTSRPTLHSSSSSTSIYSFPQTLPSPRMGRLYASLIQEMLNLISTCIHKVELCIL